MKYSDIVFVLYIRRSEKQLCQKKKEKEQGTDEKRVQIKIRQSDNGISGSGADNNSDTADSTRMQPEGEEAGQSAGGGVGGSDHERG